MIEKGYLMKTKLKMILSLILSTIIIFSSIAVSGIIVSAEKRTGDIAKDISTYNVGDTFEFGSYPQSKVEDTDLLSTLEKVSEKITWIDYNYYAGTGDMCDGKMAPVKNMMQYKDISYNSEKYRAVKLNQYRPSSTDYLSSVDNSNQDDNEYYIDNTYYFKFEPLLWRVLDPEEGYVMCNSIIDSQAFQNFIVSIEKDDEYTYYNNTSCTIYASDWATSSIRIWLNEDFYKTAFTDEEQAKIGVSYLENKSSKTNNYDSINTSDKIFLISYYDAINSNYGFNSIAEENDTARLLQGTDYAKSQGLYIFPYKKYGATNYVEKPTWWLRSPRISYSSCNVCYTWANFHGSVNTTDNGIVPAFKFNPKNTIPDGSNNSSDNSSFTFFDRISSFFQKIIAFFKNLFSFK